MRKPPVLPSWSLALSLLCGLGFHTPTRAQCASQWLPETPAGTDNTVLCATTWDPDGTGPLPTRLVVAGDFFTVAGQQFSRIASFDPSTQTWSGFGSAYSFVAVTAAPNGTLYATEGTQLMVWNGSSWTPVGGSLDRPIISLAMLPNGHVMAAGAFTMAGGVPSNGFSVWDGSAWQNLGIGVPVIGHALHVLPNGHVLVSGRFTIGGNAAYHVARWNGVSWTMLGTTANADILSVTSLPNGDIVAGGLFTAIGGVPAANVARWNGTAWSSLSAATTGMVRTLHMHGGTLYAGGEFLSIGGVPAARLAAWNGGQWQSVGSGANGVVRVLGTNGAGDLFAGGSFDFLDGQCTRGVGQRIGGVWTSLPASLPRPSLPIAPTAMLGMRNGDCVAAAPTASRWDGTRWAPIGSGGPASVTRFAELPNGNLVAADSDVSVWNGTSWQNLGAPPGTPSGLAAAPDGSVLASSSSGVFRWSGTTWNPLGNLPNVVTITASRSGLVYAVTGLAWVQATTVHRWNGASWQVIGNVGGGVRRLVMEESDQLLAAGSFANVNGVTMYDIARWNGTTWQAFGTGGFPLTGIAHVVADPIVVAGGFYSTPNGPANQLARWDGTAWQPLGSGPGGTPTLSGAITSLAQTNTSLWVGGAFPTMDGLQTTRVAELAYPCPALATETGSGCAGSGGLPHTEFHPRPWLGATCTSRTTGLADPAMAFVLYGFTNPNLTLASLHPLGGPGCRLLANNDSVSLLFPFAGEITTSLTIPIAAAFVGVTFFHQVVEFELDANGFTTGLHSGNGLRLQFGTIL